MKYLVCIALVCCSYISASAQHCPFDFAAMIVVHVHDEDSTRTIPGLRITLIDSTGKGYVKMHYRNGRFVEDTVRFWQNPPKTTYRGYIDNENPGEMENIRFPFAKDNYVLIVGRGMDLTGFSLRVETTTENSQYLVPFSTIPLHTEDAYALCGVYDDNKFYPREYGQRVYSPVEIILHKKR